ncbi:MAG TPA: 4-phosphoerythronate dehydrogenase [Ignavibacteriaceae bacterium]|mgnify:CR=1 FL=1|nr:4-phosphoerythronate dehydrogenase [Ignavibacteriaceae bacterium]
MKIICDENISFAEAAFSQFGKVELLQGRKINNAALNKADVLIVRSITKVDKSLLENTNIKFVGTATIGTDHVDINYLNKRNIKFADAAGCNSDAVTEYLFTALFRILADKNISLKNKSMGVIGVGNIGSRVVKLAKAVGLEVIMNDPPLQRKTSSKDYAPLEEALQADIVTFHVPLTLDGKDKTIHLLDQKKIKSMKDGIILINASRGPVVDNTALSSFIDKKKLNVVLDVWEHEPEVDINLLNQTLIATPHIAGYSLEGKVNGTYLIYKNFCNFLGETPTWQPTLAMPEDSLITAEENKSIEETLNFIFSQVYQIRRDDKKMRHLYDLDAKIRPSYFDLMRKEYPYRREFNNYFVKNPSTQLKKILEAFRFNFAY